MAKDTHGLSVSKPVSVWKRPLKVKPKGFLLNLGKAVIKGTQLEFDDALEKLADALKDVNAKEKAGQIAWALIYRALIQAVADIVQDSKDLFDLAGNPPGEQELAQLFEVLTDHLDHCETRIDKEFFDHPECYGLFKDFQPAFQD